MHLRPPFEVCTLHPHRNAGPGAETHKLLSVRSLARDLLAAGADKPSLGLPPQLHELLVRSCRWKPCPEPLAGGGGCAALAALRY